MSPKKKSDEEELETYFSEEKIKIPETESVNLLYKINNSIYKLNYNFRIDLVFANYGRLPVPVFLCR